MIPLLALNKTLGNALSIKTAFLAQRNLHELLRQLEVDVLDLDHQKGIIESFHTQMIAYNKFSPDVVVDDTCLSTAFSAELANLPRITIQRTGSFSGGGSGNENHRHSLHFDLKSMPDITYLGARQPTSFSDLFKADIKIIPGIRTIEILPDHLQDDPSYVFSGPLLMDDFLVDHIGALFSRGPEEWNASMSTKNFDSLQRFFDYNLHRKTVYLTFGMIANPPSPILDCIRFLLENDIAVVSNVKVNKLEVEQQSLYFYAHYLPMRFICSNVDLMVHQCGSGTYHYPIIHNVPAITIGTQCIDREWVALRLQELGASIHIPSPKEHHEFTETFKRAVNELLNDAGESVINIKNNLAILNEEIQRTSSAFVFKEVLEKVIRSSKTKT